MSKYVSHDGNIVYAQPIQSFSHSGATGGALVVLADGSTRLRPTLHGYAPKVGDMFVEAVALTVLSDSRAYAEPPETAIINPTLFARLYVLAPEFAEKPGETTIVEGIEYTNAGAAPEGILSSELPHDIVTAVEIEPQPDAIVTEDEVIPIETTGLSLEDVLDAAVDAEPEDPEDNFEPPTVGNEVV